MTYDPFGNEINENDMKENSESPEKGKPFLTDEEETIAANEYVSHIENPIYTASIKEEIKGDFIAGRRSGFNAAAEKANKRIAELGEEIERLQYWHNEKDQEADAERVSLAVAEIESDIQQATKEQERDWYNAGCMAERIIWRGKVEQERECLKKYLMDFIEERKALCKNINDNSPDEWKSFKYVADAVLNELNFLQSVIHAIEPYKP